MVACFLIPPPSPSTHGLELQSQGAGILDIGGESTRPGAAPVAGRGGTQARGAGDRRPGRPRTSLRSFRSIPRSRRLRPPRCARCASIVNDVTALRAAPEIAGLVADSGAERCPMHMLGDPRTMQSESALTTTSSGDVKRFLEERMAFAVARGRGPRSGSCSTRGSASARRSPTTWSCWRGWVRSVALGQAGCDRDFAQVVHRLSHRT